MKKIYLSLDEMDLGYLIEDKKAFVFVANEEGVNSAQEKNPIAMQFFSLNRTGKKVFLKMPHTFSQFLITDSRKDLMLKANIDDEDSQFEKLFKLAELNLMKINFRIHK